MAVDMNNIRAQFPVFRSKTYINSSSYGALCLDVQAAFAEYLETRAQYGSRWDLWVAKLEQLRGLVATLIGADTADIAISTSVSEAVNALASAYDFSGDRDKIVLTDFDFPTTSQIWLAQQHRGARIARARADASGTHIPVEHFAELIDEHTALVSIPYVCYRNGVRIDPAPIIELAHAHGARVLIDAYQAVGTFPVDVTALGVDYLIGGCLKYLIGTAGVSYLYVRDSVNDPMQPLFGGWFAQADIHAMDIYHNEPAADARRFESGTPNVAGLYAASAGLEYLLRLGVATAAEQIDRLTGLIIDGVRERGWALTTPETSHGAMLAIRSNDAPALVARLASADIVVSERDGNVRVSPHFYNDNSDVIRLFEQLENNADLLTND